MNPTVSTVALLFDGGSPGRCGTRGLEELGEAAGGHLACDGESHVEQTLDRRR